IGIHLSSSHHQLENARTIILARDLPPPRPTPEVSISRQRLDRDGPDLSGLVDSRRRDAAFACRAHSWPSPEHLSWPFGSAQLASDAGSRALTRERGVGAPDFNPGEVIAGSEIRLPRFKIRT